MQIISYSFIILKHIQINSQFVKDIDAESSIIIFIGTICTLHLCLSSWCVFPTPCFSAAVGSPNAPGDSQCLHSINPGLCVRIFPPDTYARFCSSMNVLDDAEQHTLVTWENDLHACMPKVWWLQWKRGIKIKKNSRKSNLICYRWM